MQLRSSSTARASYQRAPDFSGDQVAADYSFACLSCEGPLAVPGQTFVDRAWTWDEAFDSEQVALLRRHFDISTTTGKSHDGGRPVFLRASCARCGAQHIIYAGVQETSNTYYAVWIHGVARAIG